MHSKNSGLTTSKDSMNVKRQKKEKKRKKTRAQTLHMNKFHSEGAFISIIISFIQQN